MHDKCTTGTQLRVPGQTIPDAWTQPLQFKVHVKVPNWKVFGSISPPGGRTGPSVLAPTYFKKILEYPFNVETQFNEEVIQS